MLRIYYLLLLLAVTNMLSAQSLMSPAEMHNYITSQLLQKQSFHHAAAKTTVIKERLLATSTYYPMSGGLTLYDTTFNGYAGSTRGSQYNFNGMSYSYGATFFQLGPMVSFYSYAPDQLMVKADTILDYYVSSSVPTLFYAYYFSYDASNRVLTRHYLFQDTATIGNGTKITYNGSGNLANIVFYTDTLGHAQSDSTQFRIFNYNGSGQLVSDSIAYHYMSGWRRYVKFMYYYNGSGNITKLETYYGNLAGDAWNLYSTANVTYSGGNIQTIVTDTGASHGIYTKDSMGYTGSLPFNTLDYQYNWTGTLWDTARFTTKTLNSSMLPDTVKIISKTGSVHINYLNYFMYDSYNQPVFEHDSTIGTSSYYKHYYYQTYDAVHLPQVSAGNEDISLYPNPAEGVIHLSRTTNLNATLTFSIVNSIGRQVGSGNLLAGVGNTDVPIQQLAPGMYFITLRGETGQNIKTLKFIKE
jgi:hypothetical protein